MTITMTITIIMTMTITITCHNFIAGRFRIAGDIDPQVAHGAEFDVRVTRS
jgi:hypothetical protein